MLKMRVSMSIVVAFTCVICGCSSSEDSNRLQPNEKQNADTSTESSEDTTLQPGNTDTRIVEAREFVQRKLSSNGEWPSRDTSDSEIESASIRTHLTNHARRFVTISDDGVLRACEWVPPSLFLGGPERSGLGGGDPLTEENVASATPSDLRGGSWKYTEFKLSDIAPSTICVIERPFGSKVVFMQTRNDAPLMLSRERRLYFVDDLSWNESKHHGWTLNPVDHADSTSERLVTALKLLVEHYGGRDGF